MENDSSMDGGLEQSAKPKTSDVSVNPPENKSRKARLWLWILVSLFTLAILAVSGFLIARRVFQSREESLLQEGRTAMQAGDFAIAETALNQALTIQPAQWRRLSLEALDLRAESLFRQEKNDQALQDIEAVLSVDPKRPDLLAFRGKIILDSDEEEALENFEASLAADPKQPELYALRAKILFENGDISPALAEAKEAQALDDSLSLPYTIEAYQAYLDLRYSEAYTASLSALERNDPLPITYRIAGNVLTWRYQLNDALAYLDQALEKDPNDYEALAMRTFVHLGLENWKAAEADVSRAVSVNPEGAATLWAQALWSQYNRDYQKSLDLINQAIAIDPRRPEFYTTRALAYPTTAQEADALVDFEQALSLAPNFPGALAGKAWLLLEQYELDQASGFAQRLIDLYPQWEEGLLILSEYYSMKYEPDKSLDYANQAMTLHPENAAILKTRGDAYLAGHELDQAAADYEQALVNDSKLDTALLGLALVAYEKKDLDTALAQLDKALAIDPANPSTFTARAMVFMRQKDKVKAQAELQKALQIDPGYPLGLILQSRLHSDAKDNLQALSDVNEGIKARPKDESLLIARAMVYIADENYDRARQDAVTALNMNRESPAALGALAQIDSLLENWDSALYSVDKALQITPWSSELQSIRCNSLIGTEDYTEAVESCNKVLELDPEQTYAFYLLAQAHRNLGDYDFAILDLEKFLKATDDVNQTHQAEEEIAFLKTIPPVINGIRTFSDPKKTFNLSIPEDWIPEPTENIPNLALMSTLPEDKGFGWLMVFTGDLKAIKSPEKFYEQIAEPYINSSYYKEITSEFFQGMHTRGYMRIFNIDYELEGFDTFRARIQEFYFMNSKQVVIIQFISDDYDLDLYQEEVEEIASSFKFVTNK